jgi:hypothetical protein
MFLKRIISLSDSRQERVTFVLTPTVRNGARAAEGVLVVIILHGGEFKVGVPKLYFYIVARCSFARVPAV